MSDEADWGPWIEHDGRGCPCVGRYVGVESEWHGGRITYDEGCAGSSGGFSWDWQWFKKPVPGHGGCSATRIISYRIRRPKGMAILNAILADLPAPVKTDGVIA